MVNSNNGELDTEGLKKLGKKKRHHRKAGTNKFQEDLPTTSNRFDVMNNQHETSSEVMHMDTIFKNSKIQYHIPPQSSGHTIESENIPPKVYPRDIATKPVPMSSSDPQYSLTDLTLKNLLMNT